MTSKLDRNRIRSTYPKIRNKTFSRRQLLAITGTTTLGTLAGCGEMSESFGGDSGELNAPETQPEDAPTLVEAFFRIPPAEEVEEQGTIDCHLVFQTDVSDIGMDELEDYLLVNGDIEDTGSTRVEWFTPYVLTDSQQSDVAAEYDIDKELVQQFQAGNALRANTGSKIRMKIRNTDIENPSRDEFAIYTESPTSITIPSIAYAGPVADDSRIIHVQLPDGQTRNFPAKEYEDETDVFPGRSGSTIEVKYDFTEKTVALDNGETLTFETPGPIGTLRDYEISGWNEPATELVSRHTSILNPAFGTVSAVWRAHEKFMRAWELNNDSPEELGSDIASDSKDLALQALGWVGPSPDTTSVGEQYATVGTQAAVALKIGGGAARATGDFLGTFSTILDIYNSAEDMRKKAKEMNKQIGELLDSFLTELEQELFFSSTCKFFSEIATVALSTNPNETLGKYNRLLSEIPTSFNRGGHWSGTVEAEKNYGPDDVNYFYRNAQNRAQTIGQYAIPPVTGDKSEQEPFNSLLLSIRKSIEGIEDNQRAVVLDVNHDVDFVQANNKVQLTISVYAKNIKTIPTEIFVGNEIFRRELDAPDGMGEVTTTISPTDVGLNKSVGIGREMETIHVTPQPDSWQNYPMAGYNGRNTGYNPDSVGPSVTSEESIPTLWETDADEFSKIGSKPSYADGSLYINASWEGGQGIAAIDAFSGTILWKTSFEKSALGTPAVVPEEGVLYTVTSDVQVRQLNLENGEISGRAVTSLSDTQIPPYLTVTDEGVYFVAKEEPPGFNKTHLFAFERDLAQRFVSIPSIETGSVNNYQFAVNDDIVVLNARDLVAFDKQSGEEQWTKEMSPGVATIASNETIFAGATRAPGSFTDWQMLKRFSATGEEEASTADAQEFLTGLCITSNEFYYGSNTGVIKVNRQSLNTMAQFPTQDSVTEQPQVVDNRIYIVDNEGHLSVYDLSSKQLIEDRSFVPDFSSRISPERDGNAPLVAEGLVFLSYESGGISALGRINS